mmetsp:Transcript_512/g.621  ORF Transcript_512/g.621 Transcript_512/m.621 type:complete len:114 (+) Transcript_512:81-422(+)
MLCKLINQSINQSTNQSITISAVLLHFFRQNRAHQSPPCSAPLLLRFGFNLSKLLYVEFIQTLEKGNGEGPQQNYQYDKWPHNHKQRQPQWQQTNQEKMHQWRCQYAPDPDQY